MTEQEQSNPQREQIKFLLKRFSMIFDDTREVVDLSQMPETLEELLVAASEKGGRLKRARDNAKKSPALKTLRSVLELVPITEHFREEIVGHVNFRSAYATDPFGKNLEVDLKSDKLGVFEPANALENEKRYLNEHARLWLYMVLCEGMSIQNDKLFIDRYKNNQISNLEMAQMIRDNLIDEDEWFDPTLKSKIMAADFSIFILKPFIEWADEFITHYQDESFAEITELVRPFISKYEDQLPDRKIIQKWRWDIPMDYLEKHPRYNNRKARK